MTEKMTHDTRNFARANIKEYDNFQKRNYFHQYDRSVAVI